MIQVSGLVKHYGDVRAVDGVDFAIGRGEIVGFLGPNGAGKSTTMRMLTGYLYPDQGEILIRGHRLNEDPLKGRAAIGYLPEHTALYQEMRVDRYLGFVARVRGLGRSEARSAVERVIGDADLEGYTSRRIHTLSKGYRQRVGLAQALISDPDILILDEPTSGLDPAEIVRIRDRIVSLAETKTIMLSTHVLPEVEEVCRRVLIIAGGKIVADGSVLDLSGGQGESLLVTLGCDEQEGLQLLGQLGGVQSVEVRGRGAVGRIRFHLDVGDRFEVAEQVTRLAVGQGWPLFEVKHDVPTLERVFLHHTRGLGSAKADPEAEGTVV